jgi:hypothetical protein
MKLRVGILLTCAASGLLAAQAASGEPNPLLRQYRDGERLTYHMKGTNEAWHYQIQAEGVVKKDADGTYFEEYGWSHLISDDQETALPAGSTSFRQQVTLDPNRGPSFPNLSQVDSRLVGPMTDFLTFYVDLWLAAKTGQITHPGDHFYFRRGTPSSWADGSRVLIGESSVDFDLTLKDVNPTDGIATVVIMHLPPEKPEIKLPADWMRKPVADTPNNWVQLQKTKDNRYLAGVGKETFEVQITPSLVDGKILFATMDNRVETLERECADSALTKCSDAKPHLIERRIEISLTAENGKSNTRRDVETPRDEGQAQLR